MAKKEVKVENSSPKRNEGICIYEQQEEVQIVCLCPYSANTKCRKIGCKDFKQGSKPGEDETNIQQR